MRLKDLKPGESATIANAEQILQERGLRVGKTITYMRGSIYKVDGISYVLRLTDPCCLEIKKKLSQ